MGYSKAYTVFTGALEFIGGMLLLSRRTSTLGALTTFGVMLNVMMMNICYDVPVKQLSTHLVLMSIFLISLDVKRLWSFFIKNDSAAPRRFQEIIPAKYIKYKNIIKWILITGCLCFSISKMLAYKKIRSQATDSIFHGKHTVEKFERMRTVENNSEPTTFEDWKLFYQSWEGHAQVKTINDRQVNIRFEPDTVTNLVQVKINNFSDYKEWTYMVLESGKIQLNGIYDSDTLEIILKKENINDNLLVSRGFRWINEYPFNR